MDKIFVIYITVVGIIFSPWFIVIFVHGICRAWDEIDTLKRYIKGY